jgi:CYTH domain-containing protein
MPKNLEIEKRYLLKKLPNILDTKLLKHGYDEVHYIDQHYGKSGRFRRSEIYLPNKPILYKYVKTIKKAISRGVNSEIENDLTAHEFENEIVKCNRIIRKVRWIKKVGKYKWEIDVFKDINMVIAEVEVKTKKELKTVSVPKFIKEQLLIDITGDKIFSNYNLSIKK